MKALVIAAPMSGAGKTTITLGLMECFKRRGFRVAPFKVGPDFIDPGYHRLVTGRPSVNLDGWMCSPDYVRHAFLLNAGNADIAVIEGVMGLFDGIGGRSDEGSTAQAARLIGAPVVLVVDAKGMARSAGALVKGFATLDPDVRISGVIFNNVASEHHGRILREAVSALVPEVGVLGCIPRDPYLQIPSRHLGLVTADENPLDKDFLDHLVEVVRKNIDLAMLWRAATPTDLFTTPQQDFSVPAPPPSVRIAVARDPAFCFAYESNLQLLREAGAELAAFSPLTEKILPEGIGGIYLPGGYPELFAEPLAANKRMKQAIRAAIELGMPVYAECGGFIYLSRGVVEGDGAGEEHRFVGVFPVVTRMLSKRKALGYREIELKASSLFGGRGLRARGHEFHYSEMGEVPPEFRRIYRVSGGRCGVTAEGYSYKNCLASYIHLHFGSNPKMALAFVGKCRKFAERHRIEKET